MMLNKKDLSLLNRVLTDEENRLESFIYQVEYQRKKASSYELSKSRSMLESIKIVKRKLQAPQGCW